MQCLVVQLGCGIVLVSAGIPRQTRAVEVYRNTGEITCGKYLYGVWLGWSS